MTYTKSRHYKGNSTTLVSSRIQISHIEFCQEHGFMMNRWANAALDTLVHELQVDYNVEKERYWLTNSGGLYTGYEQDYRGSQPKMLRIKSMNVEYLKFNQYKLNTAINLALERWEDYFENGKVAERVIQKITKKDVLAQKRPIEPAEHDAGDNDTPKGNKAAYEPKTCEKCYFFSAKTKGQEEAPCGHPTKHHTWVRYTASCPYYMSVDEGIELGYMEACKVEPNKQM